MRNEWFLILYITKIDVRGAGTCQYLPTFPFFSFFCFFVAGCISHWTRDIHFGRSVHEKDNGLAERMPCWSSGLIASVISEGVGLVVPARGI